MKNSATVATLATGRPVSSGGNNCSRVLPQWVAIARRDDGVGLFAERGTVADSGSKLPVVVDEELSAVEDGEADAYDGGEVEVES